MSNKEFLLRARTAQNSPRYRIRKGEFGRVAHVSNSGSTRRLKPGREHRRARLAREQKIMDAMADLVDLDDEETYKRVLAEKFGIKPGNPRYQAGSIRGDVK